MGEQFQAWQLTTVEELCAYFGFMIPMGIVRLPRLGDYWKKLVIYRCMQKAFHGTDSMIFIGTCTSNIDNSTLSPAHTPGYNKLGKIAPIITMLRNRFAHVWNLGKNISIDEAMIPFKGEIQPKTVHADESYQAGN